MIIFSKKISENVSIKTFLSANLSNVCLNRRQLDSHICSCFSVFQYVVLIDLYEENQASHSYVIGKRGPSGLWISGNAARKKLWGSGGEAKSTMLGWGVWSRLGGNGKPLKA